MQPRFTVVRFKALGTDTVFATGEATCHPGDQFDRGKGISLAFKRALLMLKEVDEGGRRPAS